MSRKLYFLLLLVFFLPTIVHSQVNIRDSAIFTPLIYATYSYQFPGGDLAKRFGGNSTIGGGLMFKTKSNWIFGAEGNFIFGQSIKNSDSLLLNISTPEGMIIDQNGYYAEIIYYERGYSILGKVGKIIPILSPNPNCGFMITAGGGYLQNKIRISNPGNTAPQLQGDYKKGYDKLNRGWAVTGSLGYIFLSNTRLINFYLGFEFMQVWSRGVREFDFSDEAKYSQKYNSQFYGIKVCWFIPLYKRTPREYYLY